MRFIGRAEELKRIQTFLNSDHTNLAVVYGRRRVGKSLLLKEALRSSGIRSVYMECRRTSEQNNVSLLAELAGAAMGVPALSADSFEALLETLFSLGRYEPLVLVLDEYPFLRDLVKGADSILQALVDRYKGSSQLKVILCGSYIDLMKGILDYVNPLYGRAGLIIDLRPMDYYESAGFYSEFSDADKVRLYAVFGGMPYYNALIDPNKSVADNIVDLLIAPGATLATEIELFLTAEISKINQANLVFDAMSAGKRKFAEIASATQLPSSTTADILGRLCKMSIVEKNSAINQSDRANKSSYLISDNMILFYYRYVYRNLSKAGVMDSRMFFRMFIETDFETAYVPRKFEDIARQFLIRRNRAGLIDPPFYRIGRYAFDDPVTRKNGEFDVVTEDEAGYRFFEVKFIGRPLSESEIRLEVEKARSSPLKAERFGFIARSGFETTTDSPNQLRYTLADIYSPLE